MYSITLWFSALGEFISDFLETIDLIQFEFFGINTSFVQLFIAFFLISFIVSIVVKEFR